MAPTPSGYLHAGNALNFLLAAALATEAGASLLLRIDDLDRQRYRMAYARDVFETLDFLNIRWSEGPADVNDLEQRWSQQWRLPLYEAALEKLAQAQQVFACTCSRAQQAPCHCHGKKLPLASPGACWRLLTGPQTISVLSAGGEVQAATLPDDMKNFVVRKKDGLPAYQLSSLVDDLHFGVDFIVRGQDLWPSTLAQLYLARRLGETGFLSVRFLHHRLLTDVRGEKLSKSAGATSVRHWREAGKTPVEFLAYLGTLLGIQKPLATFRDVLPVLTG